MTQSASKVQEIARSGAAAHWPLKQHVSAVERTEMADAYPNLKPFGRGCPPDVLFDLGACLPEAVAELLLWNSWTSRVSGKKRHGKQAPFEVEIAAAIHKWMTYTNWDDRLVVRELSTAARKDGGRSIDLALLHDRGKRADLADALVEIKIFEQHPGHLKNHSKNGEPGGPKAFKLGKDLDLLRDVRDPDNPVWRTNQSTLYVAVVICLSEKPIEGNLLRTIENADDMRLAATQSFVCYTRSASNGQQAVQIGYIVANSPSRRRAKTAA